MPNDPSASREAYWRHWFEVVEGQSLRQGDMFRDAVATWLPEDLEPPTDEDQELRDLPFADGTWIVMTPSCDLEQKRTNSVLLGQVHPATPDTLRVSEGGELDKRLEVIRQGRMPGMFMLPPCEDVQPHFPLSVAFFRNHVLLPISYVEKWCQGPRLRLRHPVRESFGNWVGSHFAAVGPEDSTVIPRFAKIHDHQVVAADDG